MNCFLPTCSLCDKTQVRYTGGCRRVRKQFRKVIQELNGVLFSNYSSKPARYVDSRTLPKLNPTIILLLFYVNFEILQPNLPTRIILYYNLCILNYIYFQLNIHIACRLSSYAISLLKI